MVVTDLISDQFKERPQDYQRAKHAFNLLGDRVETVTPWLVSKVLANDKHGAAIQWLTTGKLLSRLISARFRPRDLFAGQ